MEEQSPITSQDNDSEITYKDFLPANDGQVKPHYESFRTLMNHANNWLKLNTHWKVRTCETLEFTFNNTVVDTSKMVYVKNASLRHIIGLRLWLQRFPPGEENVQEIGYINLIPKITYGKNDLVGFPEFEKLGDVVMRYNEESQSSPIPGRIITIETPPYKVRNRTLVDPEFTHRTEYHNRHYQFAFIIRIYYEVGEPMREKIGFQDFIPNIERDPCFSICREYQEFSVLTYKASRWCLRQTNLRICNNQFLLTKLVGTTTADSTKMSYVKHGAVHTVCFVEDQLLPIANQRSTAFLRILRVAYIRLPHGVKVPFARFTCKSFLPVLLRPGVCCHGTHPEFETLKETVQRASAWIKEKGANVLSIETSDCRLYKKGAAYSSGVTCYFTPSLHDRYCFFIIRVYMDGEYGEENEEDSALVPSHACCCSIQ